jgi:hypothetical protein
MTPLSWKIECRISGLVVGVDGIGSPELAGFKDAEKRLGGCVVIEQRRQRRDRLDALFGPFTHECLRIPQSLWDRLVPDPARVIGLGFRH